MIMSSKLPLGQRILCYALNDLTKERSIDEIRARDIYQAAGVTANTFYYHFKDKYDCASLLVKILECELHTSYTGQIDNFYDYIASSEFLTQNLLQGETSECIDDLWTQHMRGLKSEFKKTVSSVEYWRQYSHIWKNILSSEAQNSPYWEHKKAWIELFNVLIGDVDWLAPQNRQYLLELQFSNHISFWRTHILSETMDRTTLEKGADLYERVSYGIFDAFQMFLS